MDDASRLARIGERAAAEIHDGALVGLGTGSTAEAMIRALGERVGAGMAVTGVTTSERTSAQATALGIPLVSIDDVDRLDLCIDGADEIDPDLNIVKGRGGALLWEKLTARRARRYIIIALSEKLVEQLGTRLPLPVEIVPHGWRHTSESLVPLGLHPVLRTDSTGDPYITDGGHYIVDCDTGGIDDAVALARSIKALTGVVDHGLFIDMVDLVLTIDELGEIGELSRSG
jgi:ribose 5-phosphate isomerase A